VAFLAEFWGLIIHKQHHEKQEQVQYAAVGTTSNSKRELQKAAQTGCNSLHQKVSHWSISMSLGVEVSSIHSVRATAENFPVYDVL